jgi:(2Fe-2S) ferredoxin
MKEFDRRTLVDKAASLKFGHYERHVFLCVGSKCCKGDEGDAAWSRLKGRLKEMGLRDGRIYATKVHCLRLCKSGPVAVVYPEGTWYGRMQGKAIDRLIDEHLLGGKPVADYVFAEAPLEDGGEPGREPTGF